MHPKLTRMLFVCLTAILLCTSSAHAEEKSSEPKVIDGVDPTVFVIRADLKNIYSHGPNGARINTTLLRGDYVIKRRFMIRIDAPITYADLPGSNSKYGFGDLSLRLGGTHNSPGSLRHRRRLLRLKLRSPLPRPGAWPRMRRTPSAT